MQRILLVTAALLLVAAVAPCTGVADVSPPLSAGEWHTGRASWYGTPEWFVGPIYAKTRGGGITAFGVLEWGGCGYTNDDGSLIFPNNSIASYADANVDFPGSCGRCYEVKCKEGLVLGKNDQPVDYVNFYYYPKYGNMPDSQGRTFPGNPAETESHVYVKCWDPNKSIIVHIIDICQCQYTPTSGPEAGKTYEQSSCCGNNSNNPKSGQHEFDLSFWAYEQLAHPEYPEMMLQFRPVDCATGKPVRFSPGYISTTIYDEVPGTGWAFFPFQTPTHNFKVVAKGEGVNGGAAACAEVSPSGGMTFLCRNCSEPGYQPFSDVKTIEFWVKSKNQPGQAPPVQLILGDQEHSVYCHNHVFLSSLSSVAKSGDWLKYSVPLSDFQCVGDAPPSKPDGLTFLANPQNTGNTWFCLDQIKLLK